MQNLNPCISNTTGRQTALIASSSCASIADATAEQSKSSMRCNNQTFCGTKMKDLDKECGITNILEDDKSPKWSHYKTGIKQLESDQVMTGCLMKSISNTMKPHLLAKISSSSSASKTLQGRKNKQPKAPQIRARSVDTALSVFSSCTSNESRPKSQCIAISRLKKRLVDGRHVCMIGMIFDDTNTIVN